MVKLCIKCKKNSRVEYHPYCTECFKEFSAKKQKEIIMRGTYDGRKKLLGGNLNDFI